MGRIRGLVRKILVDLEKQGKIETPFQNCWRGTKK